MGKQKTTGSQEDVREKQISVSLEAVAQELESMQAVYQSQSKNLPAPVRHIEKRIAALQDEMNEISDKMLAYKLKRLASSKMLQSVSSQQLEPVAAEAEIQSEEKNSSYRSSTSRKNKLSKKSGAAKNTGQYESSTFKCKSDLDQCLLHSRSALDKALCFTLFIRCAIKG